MKFDVIVCGAGVQGLWTANHLVDQNVKVLLLEQFPFPHTRGSSHGLSRITRYSYSTSHHTEMMIEAFKLWSELEKKQQARLFIDDLATKVTQSLDGIKKKYDKLDAAQIEERFCGILSHGLSGVYEETGGVLKANICLEALHKNFLQLGGTIIDGTRVEVVKPLGDALVEVATNKGIYRSKSVVLTCGSWVNQLLQPLNLHLPVKPLKVSVEYWQAKEPHLYDIKSFPAMIIVDPDVGFLVYSTPIMEYPGLMKVCIHYGVEVNPDTTSTYDKEMYEMYRKRLREVVAAYYPNLVPQCAVQEGCLYTETTDGDFILDYHPQHRNIVIGSGFSGHGFKLSPVVGKILADLATGKRPEYEIKHFSLERFRVKSPL